MNHRNQENTLRFDYKQVLMAVKIRTHLGVNKKTDKNSSATYDYRTDSLLEAYPD
jgi:hypothetical protein